MTHSEFLKKYLNQKIDWDSKYGAQCVDLMRFYVRDVLKTSQFKPVAGAKDFWNQDHTEYEKIVNTVEAIPQEGDIVIWGATYGPYGHVAICMKATQTRVTCFSQNDPIGSPCIEKTYTYKHILGWFRKKTMTQTVSVEKQKFEELVTKSTKYDELVRIGYISQADHDEDLKSLKDENEQLHQVIKSFDSFKEQCASILGTTVDNESIIASIAAFNTLRDDLQKKNEQFQELEKKYYREKHEYLTQISDLTKTIEQMKKQHNNEIESLKQKQLAEIEQLESDQNDRINKIMERVANIEGGVEAHTKAFTQITLVEKVFTSVYNFLSRKSHILLPLLEEKLYQKKEKHAKKDKKTNV